MFAFLHDHYFPLIVMFVLGSVIGLACVLIKGERPYQPEDNQLDRHW